MGWQGRLTLAALGALAGLGQAPFNLWPVTLLALGFAMTRIGPSAFGSGLWLGLGYFTVCLHWIFEPFLVDIARHGWMAPFAVLLMASGGALFWAFGLWLTGRVRRTTPPISNARPGPAISPWDMAAGLALAEVVRSLAFTGFPWVLLGHVWIGTPVSQAAAFVGPHGLTLVTVVLAAALASAWLGARVWAMAAAAGLAALWLPWLALDDQIPDDAPIVRIIQPNAPQHLKWEPGFAEEFYQRALGLTGQEGPVDLVVWPETSVPYAINAAPAGLAGIRAAAGDVPVVIGGLRTTETGYFNTLAVLGEAGVIHDSFDKHHLVPFGEYIPLEGLFRDLFDLTEGWTYGNGTGPALVDIPGFGLAVPAICYEYIFAEELNAAQGAGQARMMLFITNDAWFGNFAGPAQHLAQARLRAIEQGLPAIRAANTGISAMIDARGRITGQLGLNTHGALDLPLPPALPATIYSRTGDWLAFAAMALLFVAASRANRNTIDAPAHRA